MMREAQLMAPEEFAIASLQGFHQHIKEPKRKGGPLRFGFGWVKNCRSEDSVAVRHRGLLDLISTLKGAGVADPSRIFLLGFSQSCPLNYRFAFTHPNLLRGIVGICGGVTSDWDSSEVYQPTEAAVFHLAGMRDEFYPPTRVTDFAERLGTRAQNVAFKSYDAAHEIVPDMRQDVKRWLRDNAYSL